MRCRWCHNPETHEAFPQVQLTESHCIFCGACVQVCPSHCHTLTETKHQFFSKNCIRCNACVQVCPVKALTVCGRELTPEQIVIEAEKTAFFTEIQAESRCPAGNRCCMARLPWKCLRRQKRKALAPVWKHADNLIWTRFSTRFAP